MDQKIKKKNVRKQPGSVHHKQTVGLNSSATVEHGEKKTSGQGVRRPRAVREQKTGKWRKRTRHNPGIVHRGNMNTASRRPWKKETWKRKRRKGGDGTGPALAKK